MGHATKDVSRESRTSVLNFSPSISNLSSEHYFPTRTLDLVGTAKFHYFSHHIPFVPSVKIRQAYTQKAFIACLRIVWKLLRPFGSNSSFYDFVWIISEMRDRKDFIVLLRIFWESLKELMTFSPLCFHLDYFWDERWRDLVILIWSSYQEFCCTISRMFAKSLGGWCTFFLLPLVLVLALVPDNLASEL